MSRLRRFRFVWLATQCLRTGLTSVAPLALCEAVQSCRQKLRLFFNDSDCGEEFGGFDAACGELRDEFAIGLEEIVSGEFAGEDPGGLLEGLGGDVWLGELGGEKVNLEFFGNRGVVVADAGNFHRFGEGDAEFFTKFAGEGLFEGFAGADFAAGKFPFEGRCVSTAALADEDAAIGTFDDGCDDLEH